MSVEISETQADLIEKSEFIWFTTVRADGMPQPTPVWFVRDGNTFLIYTIEGSQKVKNLRANPHVALGLANADGSDVFIVQGEAIIDDATPSATQMSLYYNKYKDGIAEIGMTLEAFDQQFSVPVRITPRLVRGDGS